MTIIGGIVLFVLGAGIATLLMLFLSPVIVMVLAGLVLAVAALGWAAQVLGP